MAYGIPGLNGPLRNVQSTPRRSGFFPGATSTPVRRPVARVDYPNPVDRGPGFDSPRRMGFAPGYVPQGGGLQMRGGPVRLGQNTVQAARQNAYQQLALSLARGSAR